MFTFIKRLFRLSPRVSFTDEKRPQYKMHGKKHRKAIRRAFKDGDMEKVNRLLRDRYQ